MWLVYAFISMVTSAVSVWLYGISNNDAYSNTAIVGYTFGVIGLLLWCRQWKFFIPPGTSKKTLLYAITAGSAKALGSASLLVATHIAQENQLNTGLIVIFSYSTTISGVFASYFVYGEDILPLHTLGCVLNLIGIFLIGAGFGLADNIPFLIFTLLPFFLFSYKQTVAKQVIKELGYMNFNILASLISGIMGPLFTIFWATGVVSWSVSNWEDVALESFAAFLTLVGIFALFYSFTFENGIVGVSVAIHNSCVVLIVLLSWAYSGYPLSALEWVGMSLAVVGIITVSVAKDVTNWWRGSAVAHKYDRFERDTVSITSSGGSSDEKSKNKYYEPDTFISSKSSEAPRLINAAPTEKTV